MHKLIPLIYFYVVSLVGLILLIIGVFADVHFLVNKLSYSEYPVPYTTPCIQPQPMPLMKGETVPPAEGVTVTSGAVGTGAGKAENVGTARFAQPVPSITPSTTPAQVMQPQPGYPNFYYENCLKQVAVQRQQTEVTDLEKAISFSLVGLIVFGIHFYYARKKSE